MSDSLRVAMIIQSYLPRLGGAERQLSALAPLLQQQGVELCIFTRRYPGMYARETLNGVPILRTPVLSLPAGARMVNSLLYTLLTLAHLRRFEPDIIHAHELLSPATTAIVAQRLWGVPAVAKVLRGGQLGDLAKLRARPGGERRLENLRRHLACFIVISQEIDQELVQAGIPPQQRVFIPNGVDSSHFTPPTPAQREAVHATLQLPRAPIALYAGRLAPEKRVDLLLAAWPAVRAAHPQATLLVLGSGEETARLQQMAGGGVRFPGRVDDVLPYLHASDFFVLPSATEGLSNALLEAMAAGLPAVATAVGGAPDLFTGDDYGILVPPGDIGALENALLSLVGDPMRRARLGAKARARVLSAYSLTGVATQLLALYRRVVEGEPAAPSAGTVLREANV